MIVSGAAPPMVDGLRRVRRCMSRRVFAVSAMRARECRLYSALSIIAPSVNVLRRTRRKPSTIRGAAPDVVIGQSTAARAGAHPYRRRRSGSVLSLLQCILTIQLQQKQRPFCRFFFRTLLGQEWLN